MASPTLVLAKQKLRALVRESLQKIPHESVISQSNAIFETLCGLSPYINATSISIFLSMPTGEVQTREIVKHALQSGKAVYIPYLHKTPPHLECTPKRVMDMVRIQDLEDYESLQPDKWGIPSVDPVSVATRDRILGETTEKINPVTLDMVLVPGLAFDTNSGGGIKRMGQGRGFYDLFFERYAAELSKTPVTLCGLGLEEQFLPNMLQASELPVGPQDKLLDMLILGDGSIIQ
ncbi:putative 5-formyltetrahydrofolate cyclo-ligase [Ceratocystis platani]|uniref:5-formyltetrahydrofolate cyclo-ligase n=1 Tax=Ceratocystis fimbriata f. sp. platani TaxID=88771 RepID=A0A0F8D0V2_CERFI|nr:putative 5-formyltetrahydrofolate cyclo-ligase [Ceratocystis platani]